MDSIEFKTEIVNGVIKVPEEFKEFQNLFVSVSIAPQKDTRQNRIKDNITALDFSDCEVMCFKNINPVDYQRRMRDDK